MNSVRGLGIAMALELEFDFRSDEIVKAATVTVGLILDGFEPRIHLFFIFIFIKLSLFSNIVIKCDYSYKSKHVSGI